MAEYLTHFVAPPSSTDRRARPDPALDYSDHVSIDGSPLRPLADAFTARHMIQAGFTQDEIAHVLGHVPKDDEGSAVRAVSADV